MKKHYYAVIMAGGSGSRLWPLSRKTMPKQSLVLDGDKTLFQTAIERLRGKFPISRILIVTIADQLDQLIEEVPDLPKENYVIEPCPRGTASVVGLAALAIKARDSNGTMAILTADHLIKNVTHLHQLLDSAYDVAQLGYLVTLGITPDEPATGFGYIQKGDAIGVYHSLDVFQVKKFKEKPSLETAKKLIEDGLHVWNSGMFVWRSDVIFQELAGQMPNLFGKLMEIDSVWSTAAYEETINTIWNTIEPQTIDYGIMENAERVAVIPTVDLGWHDVGSWQSLFDVLESDPSGNIALRGESIRFDTHGTLICEDSPDRLIVTIGVKDLIIVDSGNALLVCDRKYAQRVREVVNYLEKNGRSEYL